MQELHKTFKNNFIVVILNYEIDETNEMLIFENLNSKGSPLKSFDLIRNHIISLPNNNNPKDNLQKFNEKLWNLTEIKFKNVGNQNKKEKHYERFIEFYLMFKNNSTLRKFSNYSIYKNFKKKYLNEITSDEYHSLLDELRKFAILYFSIISKENVGLNIWLLSLANKDNHIPFVFNLFDRFGEFNEEKEEWIINDKIDQYLKYSTIHLLKVMTVQGTGQSFTNMWVNISKLMTNGASTFKLKEKLERGKVPGTQETPTNEEFKKALLIAPKQNWIPRVFIDILEYIANKKNPSNEKIDYNFKTIEYILPQKAKKLTDLLLKIRKKNWNKI